MTTTDTTAAVRYTVERFDNGWHVVHSDADDNVVTLTPVANRQAGRELVKQLREGTTTEAPEVGEGGPVNSFTDPQGENLPQQDAEVVVPSPEEEATRDEADRQAAEVAAEHAAVDNDNAAQAAEDHARQVAEAAAEVRATYDTDPKAHDEAQARLDELQTRVEAPKVKLDRDRKTTLARVVEGDQLMTNLVGDGEGNVAVQPHRFSDGQVRTVATIGTRKAEGGEMPGTLYRLVFSDGTATEERYGTTSHYLAPGFARPEAQAPAEKPAPAKKAPAAKAPKAEKIATTPSRAGKLVKGSRLVLRDLGVVTVDQVSKTGEGKLEVAYTQADGEAGVREMWASTNVRIAAE